ncbi:MAG TPA: efflux RND transporter permease subunit, partial [Minicystis sp.]|nr:efflux RND transporter permease subunit [Minicystis sp.]
ALPLPAGILSDVAIVRLAPDLPSGFADVGGAALAVGGVVVAERDANVPALLTEARRRLSEARSRLPTGVDVVITYDRGELIAGVDRTLVRALAEEIAVVAGVILLFLLHGRSALVPLLTLPVVLAATFVAMRLFDVPASIMTMGGMGIALGIAVDADVVALEACHRRLEALPAETAPAARRAHLVSAAAAFVPAVTTSLLITALSFLPVFAFTGEAGRLLRPLALAKTLVIGASALVALTVAPALRATLLRGRVRAEFDSPLNRGLVRAYRPFVRFALERPALTLATAALAIVSCLPLVPRLGREFLPRLDEGELLFMPTTLPGAPPLLARNQLLAQDRAIASFAEVDTVFGKIGRADTGTDPAPFTMAETIVRLRPRAEWPRRPRARWYSSWAPGLLRWVPRLAWPEEVPLTTAELVEHLDRATHLPGWTNAWTTPARARMDMMATGFRTPLGLRVVADTTEGLDALGAAVQRALARTEGARSVVYESLGGETRLAFEADEAALDARDVDAHVATDAADLVTNGGQLADAGRDGRAVRARVHPALLDGMRGDADQLRDVTVRARDGQPVPLALVGRPAYRSVPAALRSEDGRLVGYVHIDLAESADVAGFVARGRRALEGLALGPGERLEWAGQFPLLAAGERRLAWIVPLVAFSMLGLLFLQFRSLTASLIVLAAVPFALVGSVWALHLAGYPLSAPVWVGLLSVLGLAMQTGVVMVVYIDDAFYRRVARGELATRADIVAAHAEGTVQRLRPKLMTVTTMAAALVPLAWAEGPGSEILRRVAAPMLGGLVTSTFLTLEVLPVLYTMWRYAQLRSGQRLGVPLATIVGSRPTWASESVMLRE